MRKLIFALLLVFAVSAGFAQGAGTPFSATFTFGEDGNVERFDYNGTHYNSLSFWLYKWNVNTTPSSNNFRATGWPYVGDADNGSPDSNRFIAINMQGSVLVSYDVETITFGIGRDEHGTRYTELRGMNIDPLDSYTFLNSGLTNNNGVLENPDVDGSWTGNVLSLVNNNDYKGLVGHTSFHLLMYGAESATGCAGLQGPITITCRIYGEVDYLTITPLSLTGFTYDADNNGPSPAQSFTVNGVDPQHPNHGPEIEVFASPSFEVSLDGTNFYEDSVFFRPYPPATWERTFYVRLKEGLAIGDYNERLLIDYGASIQKAPIGFQYEYISCSGSVKGPTLPVTLSHFSATMTAQNYVNLTWVSQTETNLMGYNVLRGNSDDLSSAMQICPMIDATNTSQAQTYTYLDKELVEDGTYYYWLQNVDMDGTTGFHGPASVVFSITGDPGTPSIPKVTKLEDAYPNPFNPNTTIRYQLESPGRVEIDIYNTKGQIVRSFSQNHDAAGYYNILWDGCDSSGRALASGVYLYKMTSGKYSGTKKMVLQK